MTDTAMNAKGLPPKTAAYLTGSDHRSQVERADNRRAKKKVRKARRRADKRLETTDVLSMSHRDKTRSGLSNEQSRDKRG